MIIQYNSHIQHTSEEKRCSIFLLCALRFSSHPHFAAIALQFTAGELSRADGVGFVFSQRLPCAELGPTRPNSAELGTERLQFPMFRMFRFRNAAHVQLMCSMDMTELLLCNAAQARKMFKGSSRFLLGS